MKKLCAFFLLCTIVCLSSCTREEKIHTAREVLLQIASEEGEGCTFYDPKDHIPEDSVLYNLYGNGKHLYHEFHAVKDYACVLGKKDRGYEIHILKAAHESEIRQIKQLLFKRMELLQSAEIRKYMGEDYYIYLSSACIYERKNFVFLLLTKDNEELKSAIQKMRLE